MVKVEKINRARKSFRMLTDSDGNRVEPPTLGIAHESIDGAYDDVRFEDRGDGRTTMSLPETRPGTNREPVASSKVTNRC